MLPLQSSLGFLNGFTVCVLLQYRWGYLVDGALGESGPLLHFLWWHSQSEKFSSCFQQPHATGHNKPCLLQSSNVFSCEECRRSMVGTSYSTVCPLCPGTASVLTTSYPVLPKLVYRSTLSDSFFDSTDCSLTGFPSSSNNAILTKGQVRSSFKSYDSSQTNNVA